MRKFIIIFGILLSIFSCSKENRWDCFKRTGSIESQTIYLNSFNGLVVTDQFEIVLHADTSEKIILEGGSKLLPYIRCEVDNGVLYLSNSIKCRWARNYEKQRIKVNIHYKQIKTFQIDEKCSVISLDTLSSDNFSVEIAQNVVAEIQLKLNVSSFKFTQHSGTGTYTFSGLTDSSYYYIKGTGYIYANNLKSNFTHIVNKSTGDISVHVNNKLFVEYTGSGDVYYTGFPQEIIFNQKVSTGHVYPL